MKRSALKEEYMSIPIAALHMICLIYQEVIASDKVIKSDIKKLKKYLYTSNPLITQHCKKIIDYLLVEIHEPIGSTKHTDEEKVTYQNAKNTFDNKDYFQFKDAMDNFYQNYIK